MSEPLIARLMYEGSEFAGDKDTRTWTQQYLIMGNGDEACISTATGLPRRGQAYPSDPSAFLRSIRISRDGDSNRWVANCEFRQEPDKDIDDPCRRPWEWSRDSWSRQEPLVFARRIVNGEPTELEYAVTNSAGDAFGKTPTVDRKYATYKLSKCFRLEDAPDESDYQDTVNDAEIKLLDATIPRWQGLIRDIRSSKVNEFVDVYDAAGNMIDQYYGYLKVEMEIAVNPAKWTLQLVDAGLYCRAGTVRARITDATGRECDTDYPLDGAGGKLSDQDMIDKAFAILEFVQYDAADWSPLELPEVR